MDNNMIEIIGKLLAAVVVGIMAYLTPKIKLWFEVNTTESSQKMIKLLIASFVQAAEQLLHDKDPDGSLRMEYVKNQLTSLGITLTSKIVSIIEGAVWEVNNQNKKNIQQKETEDNGNS